ncbi:MAG: hypothetical protein ACI9X4_000368 [Glaciecola sp.]|jgi:hypothetical protein
MGNIGKNLVIAICLLSAGFLVAWLRFRPHLGTEGRFTDGVREYAAIASEPLRYALWDDVLPVEGLADGASREFDPCLSPDGRWLVFAVGERGLGTNLWIAEMTGGKATNARPLSELNSDKDELAPAFGHGALYFASNREGSVGGLDIWRVPFENDRFGSVEHLADALQSKADDTDPAPIEGSLALLFASNRRVNNPDPTAPRRTGYDLYEALGNNSGSYRVQPIHALSTDSNERDPAFTADGLTLFFASDRAGVRGSYDLFRGVRTLGQWLPPKPIDGLNGNASRRGPSPSPDGFSLVFTEHGTSSDGVPASKLLSAKTRELFLKPGRPIGLTDVLLLLALLLLALLAWLAKRWARMEVIYRCFLVSIVAHALLMYWFRDITPENPPGEVAAQGPTFQVRLASFDRAASENSQERGGELEIERQQDNEAVETPQRSTPQVTQAQKYAAQSTSVVALEAAPSELPESQVAEESMPQATETPASLTAQAMQQHQSSETLYDSAAPQISVVATRTPAGLISERPRAGRPGRVVMTPQPNSTAMPTRTVQSAQPLVRMEGESVPEARTSAEAQPSATSAGAQDSSLALQAPTGSFELLSGLASELAAPLPKGEWAPTQRSAPKPQRDLASTASPSQRLVDSANTRTALPTGSMSMETALPAPATFQPKRTASEAPQRLALNAPNESLPKPQPGAKEPAGTVKIQLPKPSASIARVGSESNLAPMRFDAPNRTPQAPAKAASLARMDPLPAPQAPTSFPIAAAGVPTFERTPYRNRFGLAKEKALTELGGSKETEAAVASGLAYLASVQGPSGFWGVTDTVHDKYRNLRIGKTGLSLLAFLGAGHTTQSNSQYSSQVRQATRYLLQEQDQETGHFGDCAAYGHAVATYALAECFALTSDKELRAPLQRAVAHIVGNQNHARDVRFFGGWNYYYADDETYDSWPRVSVTSWQVMALKSARLAGLDVPKDTMEDAHTFLSNAWDRNLGAYRYNHAPSRLQSSYPTLPASTPAALFALSLLGEDLKDPQFSRARSFLLTRTPDTYRYDGQDAFVHQAQGNLYFWYYSSLALLRTGGNQWDRWNEGLKQTLLPAQSEDGSWAPISVYANYAGDTEEDRSYTTAMCVLSLEIYYRYFTPMLNADE